MLLTKRLADTAIVSRQSHQSRSSLAPTCSPQQQWLPQTHRYDRAIACFQAQQEQQLAAEVVQQECASTSTVQAAAAPVAAAQAAKHGKAAAVIYMMSKLQSKWQQLAVWCRQHRVQQLLWGGDASSGLAALSMVPLLPGGGINDLFTNRVFLAGFWAWFAAQTLKIFTKYLKKGVWDLKAIVDSGGMPSSHSALCAGITTAIAYQHGMGSSAFAVAVALSSIVMYDAAGVRRHAGKQAEVLNQVVNELLEGHPLSDVQLKEVLGHTPLQVACGCMLGVLFGIFYPFPDPVSQVVLAA